MLSSIDTKLAIKLSGPVKIGQNVRIWGGHAERPLQNDGLSRRVQEFPNMLRRGPRAGSPCETVVWVWRQEAAFRVVFVFAA